MRVVSIMNVKTILLASLAAAMIFSLSDMDMTHAFTNM